MTTADRGDRKKKAVDPPVEEHRRTPVRLLVGAWLVPGLGHWVLQKRKRAVVVAIVIFCAFVTGVLLDGEIGTPKPQSPFSWLAAFACASEES